MTRALRARRGVAALGTPRAGARARAHPGAVRLWRESRRATAPSQRTPSPVATLRGGPPAHIAVIVMENEEYGDIIGRDRRRSSTPWPAATRWRDRMYAITHPSLPNYLALTGGSTFRITSDCTDCAVPRPRAWPTSSAARIVLEGVHGGPPPPLLRGRGRRRATPRSTTPSCTYGRVAHSPAQCAHVVALTQLHRDERAHSLPRFAWITPNLCHDTHDCARPRRATPSWRGSCPRCWPRWGPTGCSSSPGTRGPPTTGAAAWPPAATSPPSWPGPRRGRGARLSRPRRPVLDPAGRRGPPGPAAAARGRVRVHPVAGPAAGRRRYELAGLGLTASGTARPRARASARSRSPAAPRRPGRWRPHEAAVGLGGLADDRQAQPRARLGAGVAGAVEAVEDEGQVLLVEARAVVAHGEDAVGQRRPRWCRPTGRTWPRCPGGWSPHGRSGRPRP